MSPSAHGGLESRLSLLFLTAELSPGCRQQGVRALHPAGGTGALARPKDIGQDGLARGRWPEGWGQGGGGEGPQGPACTLQTGGANECSRVRPTGLCVQQAPSSHLKWCPLARAAAPPARTGGGAGRGETVGSIPPGAPRGVWAVTLQNLPPCLPLTNAGCGWSREPVQGPRMPPCQPSPGQVGEEKEGG